MGLVLQSESPGFWAAIAYYYIIPEIKKYRKATFLCVRNLCEFVKTGLLINLCDQCLTHIININKSHAEICRFRAYSVVHIISNLQIHEKIELKENRDPLL